MEKTALLLGAISLLFLAPSFAQEQSSPNQTQPQTIKKVEKVQKLEAIEAEKPSQSLQLKEKTQLKAVQIQRIESARTIEKKEELTK
ncbi:MAG: hypothetical protein WC994_06300 [Brumimicrobium sp.]